MVSSGSNVLRLTIGYLFRDARNTPAGYFFGGLVLVLLSPFCLHLNALWVTIVSTGPLRHLDTHNTSAATATILSTRVSTASRVG